MSTACFTGHRPEKLPWGEDENSEGCMLLKLALSHAIAELAEGGCTRFISGMARGVDTYAAEEVLLLRDELKSITLECAVPFKGQPDGWSEEDKRRYDAILASADEVKVLAESYSSDAYLARNRYMVDESDLVIAVYSGDGGGTGATVEYAKEKGRELLVIEP